MICTDLKEVLGLMSENIEINKEIIAMKGGKIEIREMDWNSKKEEIEDILKDVDGFDYVVAADVVFNKGHLGSLTKVNRLF